MSSPYIIRTSDRGTFKECREKWNFGSKIRMDYEPAQTAQALRFGTAIHAAMEVYYDPKTWHLLKVKDTAQVVWAKAEATFKENYPKPAIIDDRIEAEWREEVELGIQVLRHYFDISPSVDQFEPIMTEIEFEVPIFVPEDMILPKGFVRNSGGELMAMIQGQEFEPVWYQGRIDLLVKDYYGQYWIMDHKTTAKFEDMAWLDLDEQCISYAWALQHILGIRIAGVIYSQIKKAYPKPPKVLKDGSLSKDKSQDTSYALYKKALDSAGLPVVKYAEHLDWLRENEKQYTRRIVVQHSQREYEILGRRVAMEAIDMLNDPSIYPNPGRNCNWCAYFGPCMQKQSGDDYVWTLEDLYVKRNG